MSAVTEEALIDMMDTISGGDLTSASIDNVPDRSFEELGFDSLARQELMGRLENKFGVTFEADVALADNSTPRELLTLVNVQAEEFA